MCAHLDAGWFSQGRRYFLARKEASRFSIGESPLTFPPRKFFFPCPNKALVVWPCVKVSVKGWSHKVLYKGSLSESQRLVFISHPKKGVQVKTRAARKEHYKQLSFKMSKDKIDDFSPSLTFVTYSVSDKMRNVLEMGICGRSKDLFIAGFFYLWKSVCQNTESRSLES